MYYFFITHHIKLYSVIRNISRLRKKGGACLPPPPFLEIATSNLWAIIKLNGSYEADEMVNFSFFEKGSVEKIEQERFELKRDRHGLLNELKTQRERYARPFVEKEATVPAYLLHREYKLKAIDLCIAALENTSGPAALSLDSIEERFKEMDKEAIDRFNQMEKKSYPKRQGDDNPPDLYKLSRHAKDVKSIHIYELPSEFLDSNPKNVVDRTVNFLKKQATLQNEWNSTVAEPLLNKKTPGYGGF